MLPRLPYIFSRPTAELLVLPGITRNFSNTLLTRTSPLKVLVSFDGCVADSEDHFLREYRRRFPSEPYVRVEERQQIPLAHQYGRLRPDLVQHVESILKTSSFYVKMAPVTGAIKALKEMQNSDALDVYLRVCPNQNSPKALHEKFQWIQKHLGQVFLERLIVAKDHSMIKADLHFDWEEPYKGNSFRLTDTRINTGSSVDISWTDDVWREAVTRRMNSVEPPRVEQQKEDVISRSTCS